VPSSGHPTAERESALDLLPNVLDIGPVGPISGRVKREIVPQVPVFSTTSDETG
jgi:hypothetical protein